MSEQRTDSQAEPVLEESAIAEAEIETVNAAASGVEGSGDDGLEASSLPESGEPPTQAPSSPIELPGPSTETANADQAEWRVGASEGVAESSCSGCSEQKPSWVYALGTLGVEFASEARHDSLVQHGLENPHDPDALLRHLESHPYLAPAVTWVLLDETTPIYVIEPAGGFAAQTYAELRAILHGQLDSGVTRVSVPGVTAGRATLASGQSVPIVTPELRGMFSWSTPALVEAALGPRPAKAGKARERYERLAAGISNFLHRVYHELRNTGLAPSDRAINYAATDAFQAARIFTAAIQNDLSLDRIAVEPSPICRPGSECWDVKLTFFNPAKRREEARTIHRFTVDVSDVVPVTVGSVRSWRAF